MGSTNQLLLWGYILWLVISVNCEGPSTDGTFGTGQSLTCNQSHTFRVFFVSDKWTTQMSGRNSPGYLIQDQFFFVMRSMVNIATGSGINCTFEKASSLLECCERKNLTEFRYVPGGKKLKVPSNLPKWKHDISAKNFFLFCGNIWLMMSIVCVGLFVLRVPDGPTPRRIIEMM